MSHPKTELRSGYKGATVLATCTATIVHVRLLGHQIHTVINIRVQSTLVTRIKIIPSKYVN